MSKLQRVLYVEDDDAIRTIGAMALEVVGGLEVRVCAGGEEAVAALDSFEADLFLLDVMMPGLDGPATLAALRAHPRGAGVPVVFMTAKAQPHEIASYRALGAAAVITKPFDPMSLAQQIGEAWEASHA